MKASTYIEREGRQFGLEDRVRVIRETVAAGVPQTETLWAPKTTLIGTFPVLRARVWALMHGYGLLPVRG